MYDTIISRRRPSSIWWSCWYLQTKSLFKTNNVESKPFTKLVEWWLLLQNKWKSLTLLGQIQSQNSNFFFGRSFLFDFLSTSCL